MNRKVSIGLITTFVIMTILATCSGCGSNKAARLLKKSEKFEKLAVAAGAKVEDKTKIEYRDTIIYVEVPVMTTDTTAHDVDLKEPIHIDDKKGITGTITANQKANGKVDVHVQLQCKPKTIRLTLRQKYTVTITRKISSGWTNWQYYSAIVGGVIFGLVAGAILSKLLWALNIKKK